MTINGIIDSDIGLFDGVGVNDETATVGVLLTLIECAFSLFPQFLKNINSNGKFLRG
jgi:hypothetical protein